MSLCAKWIRDNILLDPREGLSFDYDYLNGPDEKPVEIPTVVLNLMPTESLVETANEIRAWHGADVSGAGIDTYDFVYGLNDQNPYKVDEAITFFVENVNDSDAHNIYYIDLSEEEQRAMRLYLDAYFRINDIMGLGKCTNPVERLLEESRRQMEEM